MHSEGKSPEESTTRDGEPPRGQAGIRPCVPRLPKRAVHRNHYGFHVDNASLGAADLCCLKRKFGRAGPGSILVGGGRFANLATACFALDSGAAANPDG